MVKYLFFDLECSNCFNNSGKICEYGYVLTDEKFNILEEDFFPMAPGKVEDKTTNFDRRIYRKGKPFSWYLKPEQYYAYPEFPHFYSYIKKLMLNEETRIFGFSVTNDISHLEHTIQRYKLESLNYKAVDVQYFASKILKVKGNQVGLEKSFIALCDADKFEGIRPHLSKDDAFMTMQVLKSILEKENLNLDELISKFPKAVIESKKFNREAKAKLILKEFSINKIESNPRYRKSFIQRNRFLRYQYNKQIAKPYDRGNKTCFLSFEAKKYPHALNAIFESLKELNIELTNDFDHADYLITLDLKDHKKASDILKNKNNLKILTMSELRELSNLSPVKARPTSKKRNRRKRKIKTYKKSYDKKSYQSTSK